MTDLSVLTRGVWTAWIYYWDGDYEVIDCCGSTLQSLVEHAAENGIASIKARQLISGVVHSSEAAISFSFVAD